jgi:Tfp pilus assembly protein PilN
MAARKKKKRINLLPQEEFAHSTLGRVLAWLLSSFRVIVIITEVFVMMVFLSRFWLDAKSADLNDLIKQRQAVLVASVDFEEKFRNTQKKLDIFAELTDIDKLTTDHLNNTSSLVPPEILLSSLSFVGDDIKIEAISPNEIGIAQFVANLGASDEIEEVVITQINTDQETQSLLTFSLRLTLKNKGGTFNFGNRFVFCCFCSKTNTSYCYRTSQRNRDERRNSRKNEYKNPKSTTSTDFVCSRRDKNYTS